MFVESGVFLAAWLLCGLVAFVGGTLWSGSKKRHARAPSEERADVTQATVQTLTLRVPAPDGGLTAADPLAG